MEDYSQRLPHGGGISGPVQYQDPAIMSLSKMPPPQGTVQYMIVQYSTVLLLRSSSGQMIGGIGVSGSTVENDKIVAEAAGKITNII